MNEEVVSTPVKKGLEVYTADKRSLRFLID